MTNEHVIAIIAAILEAGERAANPGEQLRHIAPHVYTTRAMDLVIAAGAADACGDRDKVVRAGWHRPYTPKELADLRARGDDS